MLTQTKFERPCKGFQWNLTSTVLRSSLMKRKLFKKNQTWATEKVTNLTLTYEHQNLLLDGNFLVYLYPIRPTSRCGWSRYVEKRSHRQCCGQFLPEALPCQVQVWQHESNRETWWHLNGAIFSLLVFHTVYPNLPWMKNGAMLLATRWRKKKKN